MKKLIDENGRVFGLISVIDVVVIAVAAVLAVALYTKKTAVPMAGVGEPMQTVQYVVTVSNMPAGRLDSLQVNDQIFERESGIFLGTIKDIEVEDCVASLLKADGTYVMAPIEGRYDLELVVEAPGMVDWRGHYYINRSNFIGVGWTMDFNTKTTFFGGTVTEIN